MQKERTRLMNQLASYTMYLRANSFKKVFNLVLRSRMTKC